MTVLGVGNKSCSDWIETSASNMEIMSNWVAGYLSGVSNGSGGDLLRNVDGEAIFKEIDKLCKLKPSQSIFHAAESVAADLVLR